MHKNTNNGCARKTICLLFGPALLMRGVHAAKTLSNANIYYLHEGGTFSPFFPVPGSGSVVSESHSSFRSSTSVRVCSFDFLFLILRIPLLRFRSSLGQSEIWLINKQTRKSAQAGQQVMSLFSQRGSPQ